MTSAVLVHERLGVEGVGVEIILDGCLELGDTREDAAPDALPGDLGEEALHQVEPGRRGGMKRSWKRGSLASQAFTALVLWVEELSPIRSTSKCLAVLRSSMQMLSLIPQND